MKRILMGGGIWSPCFDTEFVLYIIGKTKCDGFQNQL